jgi:small subunit ribosomal protein S4
MARYTDAKCRICRREGKKLFLKGERCYSPKCPIEKKGAVPPGQHGVKRGTRTDYGQQLREKQKAKEIYGVLESQFRRYFNEASKAREVTGKKLLQILELRLDSILFNSDLAPSRSVARQLITHGHVLVDGKRVDIPSYQLRVGQTVSLGPKALEIAVVKKALVDKTRSIPAWLNRKAAVAKVVRLPERDEMNMDIDENLIVGYYSR